MRIVSLHPATTELLFAIGAGDMLVGRTDSCDYPAQARMVPSTGSEPSRVVVSVFEPDLVLTGPGQNLRDELEGYKVVSFSPSGLDDLYHSLALLGEMLGKGVEAEMVAHDLQVTMLRIEEQSKRFHKTRVYCEVDPAPKASSGYISEVIEAAGGVPFKGEVTVEALQEFDPQAIISCVPGEDNLEIMAARDGWKDLQVMRNERVFGVPEWALHRPGPRLRDGMRMVAKLLHGIEVNGS